MSLQDIFQRVKIGLNGIWTYPFPWSDILFWLFVAAAAFGCLVLAMAFVIHKSGERDALEAAEKWNSELKKLRDDADAKRS